MTWASEIFPSGSWINPCIPLTNDIISICNAIVGISEVLEYSFPSLKVGINKTQVKKTIILFSTYWAVIYGVKVNIINSIKQHDWLL